MQPVVIDEELAELIRNSKDWAKLHRVIKSWDRQLARFLESNAPKPAVIVPSLWRCSLGPN